MAKKELVPEENPSKTTTYNIIKRGRSNWNTSEMITTNADKPSMYGSPRIKLREYSHALVTQMAEKISS